MTNDKRPAFPIKLEGEILPGLTKREYFAGLFMAQMIAGEGAVMVANRDGRYDEVAGNWKEVCAMNAIEFADELLKQLP